MKKLIIAFCLLTVTGLTLSCPAADTPGYEIPSPTAVLTSPVSPIPAAEAALTQCSSRLANPYVQRCVSTLFAPLELKDGTLASDRSRDFGFYLPDLAE